MAGRDPQVAATRADATGPGRGDEDTEKAMWPRRRPRRHAHLTKTRRRRSKSPAKSIEQAIQHAGARLHKDAVTPRNPNDAASEPPENGRGRPKTHTREGSRHGRGQRQEPQTLSVENGTAKAAKQMG
mmetsp:Transcript_37467/g.79966  ORF Transcript_37467/g.79966 Transcript_37467/m.79966 type:complete len:128 (+) Transcript_37467:594-977(+)